MMVQVRPVGTGSSPPHPPTCPTVTASSRPISDEQLMMVITDAVVTACGHCWQVLVERFDQQVRAWCRWFSYDVVDSDDLSIDTWMRFWRSFTPEKLDQAHNLASVLDYLKRCAASALVDAIRRARGGECCVSMEQVSERDEPLFNGDCTLEAQELWQDLCGRLASEQELTVARLQFRDGYRPAEVACRRPDLFADVSEVYIVGRNIRSRLRRRSEWQSPRRRAALGEPAA